MKQEIFQNLLDCPESELLDFKVCGYDFQKKENEDAKFIKDMLSFANTIRSECAYIIFGVKEALGKKELLGIDQFPDDAILQQKVKDKVYPKIKFHSFTFGYNGLTFGVIEIPVKSYDEPLHCCIKLKGLEVGKIYIRRGSSNSEATGRETLAIQKWFDELSRKLTAVAGMRSLISENLTKLTNHSIPLPSSLASCLSLATALGNSDIEGFCGRELSGYPLDSATYGQAGKHRIMDVVATPLSVELAPYHNLSSNALLKHMLKQEHFSKETFFFSKPINELEEVLRNLRLKNDSTLGCYQVDDKQMYPDSERVDGKVSLYFGLAEVEGVYERIRRVAIKMLVALEVT